MRELLKKVRRLEIRIRKLVNETFVGEYHSAFKGQGLEFDEVRPYQYGDDIRNIDWNVTAKTGEVYVKQFREEREQTLLVLFDVSGSEDFGSGYENKLRMGTEIAAVMSFSAMKNNDKVGLITFTDQIETVFPPKKGKKHVLGFIRSLLSQKPKNRGTNIRFALDYVRRAFKRRSIVVLISDFLDEGYMRPLKHLARKHDLILIRLMHKREILEKGEGILPVTDAETGFVSWVHAGDANYRSGLKKKFMDISHELERFCMRNQVDFLTLDSSLNHRDNNYYIKELEKLFRRRNGRKKVG